MVSMSTHTITEFLEARIAEDEDEAETLPAWFNPAKLLAECAAKRAVIRLHDVYSHSTEDGAVDGWCALNSVLKDLAAVYADHAEYQPEWAL